jgi:multidrug efflux pump subunit AcrA (membrane-fusion protein)
MEMTKRKLATATLFTGIAVTLAACGAGSSSHVVQRVTPPSSVATTPTTATAATAPVPGSVSATPTTTSAALNSQTLDQVAADLGALDNSLSTANSDLNNPQGDS